MRKNRRKHIMTQVKIVSSSDGKQMFEDALNDCLQELYEYDSMDLIDIKYQVSWVSNENDTDDIQYSAMILYKIDGNEVLDSDSDSEGESEKDYDEGFALRARPTPSYNAYEDNYYSCDNDHYDDNDDDEDDDDEHEDEDD